jgi:hypothetical protein
MIGVANRSSGIVASDRDRHPLRSSGAAASGAMAVERCSACNNVQPESRCAFRSCHPPSSSELCRMGNPMRQKSSIIIHEEKKLYRVRGLARNGPTRWRSEPRVTASADHDHA